MALQFAQYLKGLRERADDAGASKVEDDKSVVLAASLPPAAEFPLNVAVREGDVLILGLTGEPLALTARTAERLARRGGDAARSPAQRVSCR
jgi:hypothetical protein